MQLDISNSSLSVYKALASPVRIEIIKKLSRKQMNVEQLAKSLKLSSTITLMHLHKLEDAGIISFERSGHNKLSRLKVDEITINFPKKIYPNFQIYHTTIPVGQYTHYSITPSCGLAGPKGYIGLVDEPKYFMDPERMSAGMVWFSSGFVEYQTPNLLTNGDKLEMLDLSVELGSEFPFSNNVWPSDITFFINNLEIGTWTSAGDFSDVRGKYTPAWVPDDVNQYGLQKIIRITNHGTYLDGKPFTNTRLNDLDLTTQTFTIRFEIKSDAKNQGGCTIFGKGFGNYDQDIDLKLFYS
ncbi:ArsR family transcriptional regulator [Oenococcus oeni]|uniref:ArsR/SmtB family transcription factor n=1 Tax=Oenococcus oeni TaxID=1247 RepID=UPI003EE4898C